MRLLYFTLLLVFTFITSLYPFLSRLGMLKTFFKLAGGSDGEDGVLSWPLAWRVLVEG